MDIFAHVNWLDIFIILVLIGGMLLGFSQGIIRQVILLLALYVSIIISSQFYAQLAFYITQWSPEMVSNVAQVIAFFTLLFLTGIVLTFLLIDLLKTFTNKPVSQLSRLVGGALGLVTAAIFITIGLITLAFMTSARWPGSGEGLRDWLISARQRSDIVSAFRIMLPAVLQTIHPWMPNLPPMFNVDIKVD